MIGGEQCFGHSISMGGHTDAATLREVLIGATAVVVAENMIRFAELRHDGSAPRLDLYAHWPDLEGYSAVASGDFNHISVSRRIIFMTIEEQSMSRDMSGRLEPIYRSLIDMPGRRGPADLTIYDFGPKSGYVDETLVVAESQGGMPFVARCLTGRNATESLAPCERDIEIADNLSLTFRFPSDFFPEWRELEAAIRSKVNSLLKAAGPRLPAQS